MTKGTFLNYVSKVIKIGLLFALLFSSFLSLSTGCNFILILIFSLPGGILFGAIISMLSLMITVRISFEDKDKFINRLIPALKYLGYVPEIRTDEFLTFKPSLRLTPSCMLFHTEGGMFLFPEKISVILADQNKATIVGPTIYLKRLKYII